MRTRRLAWSLSVIVLITAVAPTNAQRQPSSPPGDPRLERLKTEALGKVEARAKLVQEIIDQLFSFGELGMQEFETSKYLTHLLEQNGFSVERGVAGMPTAWVATTAVIALLPFFSLSRDLERPWLYTLTRRADQSRSLAR